MYSSQGYSWPLWLHFCFSFALLSLFLYPHTGWCQFFCCLVPTRWWLSALAWFHRTLGSQKSQLWRHLWLIDSLSVFHEGTHSHKCFLISPRMPWCAANPFNTLKRWCTGQQLGHKVVNHACFSQKHIADDCCVLHQIIIPCHFLVCFSTVSHNAICGLLK